ncbi:MAG: hypothetical protein ACO3RY_09095, partial [Opitutales bacterium]
MECQNQVGEWNCFCLRGFSLGFGKREHPIVKESFRNAAARSTQWRWIDNQELYDIGKDPGQQENVAMKNPEVMKQMKEAYDAWWDTLGPYQ